MNMIFQWVGVMCCSSSCRSVSAPLASAVVAMLMREGPPAVWFATDGGVAGSRTIYDITAAASPFGFQLSPTVLRHHDGDCLDDQIPVGACLVLPFAAEQHDGGDGADAAALGRGHELA